MTVWNFSAGPSKLPTEVLEQAAAEMMDWHGSGMSVMEMSHRGAEFTQICDEAEEDLRQLLGVPDDYAVMFMQGGATAENAIIPMNLLQVRPANTADYVVTGSWSAKSYKEAARYGEVRLAASSNSEIILNGQSYGAYCWVPEFSQWSVNPEASYLHMCTNETIGGVEMFALPDMQELGAADVPMVLDMSSHFLSRPFDVTKAGLIYAGAQKNAGPAGVTVVIARRDLLGKAMAVCPSTFDYVNVAEQRSRFNTPPTYGIYMCGLVFKWLLRQGGLTAMKAANEAKAECLYAALDASDFYTNKIHPAFRSQMNVPFVLADDSLNEAFLAGAKARGLLGLKGHKSVGGMRASIYNAMPIEGVKALVEYLKEFEREHG
ncbi:3-phosphoserine/phosphohydroxythreonine transaminase [Pelistega europaea]|uniref:Phosphoserine aminotransferase n=1 Tax=Pelistega europaea TaxID=106147 RepID=A0A7Y4LB18_9BURK|nr:3-phosphoserine/phosphohydroxythreonine transaminase [Pelistega europaea]NOL50222.1 3-phosphoserine/phosphohydroxythreonine transaminase [Pelistega europaea]